MSKLDIISALCLVVLVIGLVLIGANCLEELIRRFKDGNWYS